MYDFFDLTVIKYLFLTVIGIVCGFINVLAGGGSVFTIPAMLFLGLPGNVANGTNRVAIVIQNITALVHFFRRRALQFKLSLSLAFCTLPGAIVGAYLGSHMVGTGFNLLLAAVIFGCMLSMMLDRSHYTHTQRAPPERWRLVVAHIAMGVVGFYGGLIQVGVGLIIMPLLYHLLRLDLVATNSHKVFIVLFSSIVSLGVFHSQIDIAWRIGIALAAGNAVGGWLGARATLQKRNKLIKAILYIVSAVIIVKLLWSTYKDAL